MKGLRMWLWVFAALLLLNAFMIWRLGNTVAGVSDTIERQEQLKQLPNPAQ